MLLFNNFHTTI